MDEIIERRCPDLLQHGRDFIGPGTDVPRNEIRTRLQVAQAEPCRRDVSLTQLYAFGEEGLVLRLAHQALSSAGSLIASLTNQPPPCASLLTSPDCLRVRH